MFEGAPGPDIPLTGRRALVTGGSSGIGKAIASALCEQGASVVVAARQPERLSAVAKQLNCDYVAMDVADLVSVQNGVEAAVQRLNGLDILINNAGLALYDTIAYGDPAAWDQMFAVNALGVLNTSRVASPHMKDGSVADVVNIGTVLTRNLTRTEAGVYAATKRAMEGITEALRLEYADTRLRITLISPGATKSNLAENIPSTEVRRDVRNLVARIGMDPGEVARLVAFIVGLSPAVSIPDLTVVPHLGGRHRNPLDMADRS